MSTTSHHERSAAPVEGGASFRVTALIAGLIAIAVIALDLATKHWAEVTLAHNVPRPLIGDLLQLRLIYNSGAAFGMGSGATAVITCIQLVIAAVLVWALVRHVRSVPWALACGLLLGGALGNIHDRILREPGPFRGDVVDFLELPHWPIFNIADIAVTTGAIILVILTFAGVPFEGRPAHTASERDGTS